MDIKVELGNIVETTADTLIVNLFKGVEKPGGATGALDRTLDGAISELIANGDISGKSGEVRVVYPRGAMKVKRVLVVGLGKQSEFDVHKARNAAARAIQAAKKHKAEQVATIVHGAGIGGVDAGDATVAVVEGTLLGVHKYEKPTIESSEKEDEKHEITAVTIIELDRKRATMMEKIVNETAQVVDAVKMSRDLVFNPPNVVTPTYIADLAQEIADQVGLKLFVGGRKWAEEQGMGAFLAVAQGAEVPPQFIVLEHNGDRDDLPATVLVGKGITFDSGGLSIKSASGMITMKADMGGCAAVLGAMQAVGALGLERRVIGVMPCTENMVDGKSYRPSDVITASNGKTIEIISTDAEGRLALADGLVYAQRYEPELVIDVATLTGTAPRAMGAGVAAPMFSTDDDVAEKLSAAGAAVHERVWRFPLWDDYRKTIDSPVADMKNSGGASNGLGTSAMFLKEFTDYEWAHLDIAGQALTNKAKAAAWQKHGATGFGVRLLVQFLRS